MVKETRPDGGYTETYFNQVGVTAGRIVMVKNYNGVSQLLSETDSIYTSKVTISSNPALLPKCGKDRDHLAACVDAGIYWSDIQTIKNITYETGSITRYLGTQEDYIYQRDSAYFLMTTKVNTAEIGNNGTNFSTNGPTSFNSYLNYITGTNYQIELPEVASLCANRDQVNVSTHLASCGTLQSNYLSEFVTLYNTDGPKSLWKTLNLLRFITPGNVTNDYQNKAYAATKLEYDSYGNMIKSYIGSKIAPGVANYTLDTTKCYDVTDAVSGCQPAIYPGNYLNWEKNAIHPPTTYLYDKANGLLTQITEPNGAVTQMGYYASRRLYWVAKPGDSSGSPTYRIGYFDNANPYYSEISVKRADGQIYLEKQNYYDGLGNLFISNTPNVRVGSRANEDANLYTHSEFDYAGRVVRQSVPDVSYTSSLDTSQRSTDTLTQYDVLGRVVLTTASDGTTTQTAYSVDVTNRRLVTTVTVQNYNENHVLVNEVTETDKDVWGNIRRVVMPDTSTISTYGYDPANRMMTSYTINGVTGYITYDIGGRKLTTTDPNMGLWSYVPDDVVGKLLSQTDAAGNVTHLCYDALYRVTSKSFTSAACPPNDPNAITYVYDEGAGGVGIGQRTSMNDKSGVTHWTNDLRGRVTGISKYVKDPGNSNQNLGTYVTAYSYNPDDTQKQIAYPSNETVNFTYDRHGRQISMANSQTPGQPYLADIDFDEAGRPVTMVLPSSITVSWTYNAWNVQGGRLQHKTAVMSSTTIQDLTYTYDLAGNITRVVDAPVGQINDYTYDTLNRLKTASTPAESMVYDANNGKITSRNGVGYTYGNSAHPNAVTSYNGNSYTYNPNGNMATRTIGGTTYTLAYDPEGHMTSLAGGSVSNRYVYDGDGNLVLSVENSLKIVKLGAFEVSWNNTNCNPTGTYGTGQFNLTRASPPANCEWKTYYGAIALFIQNATAVGDATGDGIHYLLQDNLGSNTEIVETNLTVQHNRFSPWGYSASIGVQPTDNQYTGQDKSSNSGLYFYASRWYDPALGRFIQPDSIIPNIYYPLDLDRYSYSRNNPVNYNDPTGHKSCEDSTNGCGTPAPTLEQLTSIISITYGITLSTQNGSTWSYDNIYTVYLSIKDQNRALGGNLASFTNGTTLIFLKAESGNCKNNLTECYWGNADSSTQITFNSTSFLALQNVNHEFGHLINFAMGDYFVQLLANKKVKDVYGNFVMGGTEDPYHYVRADQGYAKRTLPDPHLSPQAALQHPGCTDMTDQWCRDGFTPTEEVADLYANFVANNFDNSSAGIAKLQWIIKAFESIYSRDR